MASTSEELSGQSETLREMVGFFVLDDHVAARENTLRSESVSHAESRQASQLKLHYHPVKPTDGGGDEIDSTFEQY